MRRRLVLLPITLSLLMGQPPAQTQNTPAFRLDVDLVTIPCAVVDGQGVAVPDLKREEFLVYDNGVRRTVEYLWVDTDLPLTVGVIIDSSDSQRDQLAEHQITALELLARILRPGDRAFVVSVDEDVKLWADLSGSVDELRRQMARQDGVLLGEPCPKRPMNGPGLRPASQCGGTPLWNAVYDAARLKLRPLTGNKALLILTDGFDTGSTHSANEALDEVQKSGATVYAIQYQSGSGWKFAPGLYKLAAETGGTQFRPPKSDYTPILTRIETDLHSRYVLGFRPDRLSFGKVRHQVRVEVTRPLLSVRARNTYFQIPR